MARPSERTEQLRTEIRGYLAEVVSAIGKVEALVPAPEGRKVARRALSDCGESVLRTGNLTLIDYTAPTGERYEIHVRRLGE